MAGNNMAAASSALPPWIMNDPNMVRLVQEKNEIAQLIAQSCDNDSLDARLSRNTNDLLCALMSQLNANSHNHETRIQQNETNLTNIQDSVHENTRHGLSLEERVKATEFDIAVLSGKVSQIENEKEYLHDLLNDVVSRQMRMNVIINSVGAPYKERVGETIEQSATVFRDFLRNELRMADTDKIVIESAHRMGKASETHNKPLIARLQFQTDINRIFEKVRLLKGTGNFIYIQTPPEFNERKKHVLPMFLDARNQGKRASILPNGQLIVNGRPQKALDPVPIPVCSSNDLVEVADEILVGKSELATKDSHTFIANSTTVHSTQDIRDAMDIFTMQHPKSKHIPLAFRFRDTDGTLVEDFKSSRDHGVGPQILKHIRDAKLENVVCFLSHSYEDRFIDGKTKFSLIERCVKDSLRDHQNLMVADRGGENMSAQGEDESDQSSY